MKLFVKEWPNKTATLITENGQVVWTFGSVEEARETCKQWYSADSEDLQLDDVSDTGDPSVAACLI